MAQFMGKNEPGLKMLKVSSSPSRVMVVILTSPA